MLEKISSKFLDCFTNFVTLLIKKILQLFIVDARIKDFGDFIFFVMINFDQKC